MKRAQIMGGVFVVAILLVTVCCIYINRQSTFHGSSLSSNSGESQNTRDVNADGLSKYGIYTTTKKDISKGGDVHKDVNKTQACLPCLPLNSDHPHLNSVLKKRAFLSGL